MSNSLIVNYIKAHPQTWMEDFKNMDIKVHYDGTLAIFNYGIGCDFSNSLVQEARGIIIDMTTYRVVCWPFRKFGNHIESYADEIDWDSAQVQEKIDGSIVKLYCYKGKWHWATNGVINAENAGVANTNMSFLDLIHKAINYKDIPFDKLFNNVTYIFELVSPYNKVVINYSKPMLYHIGSRSNETGQEFNFTIGIQKPKVYPLHSFEDALKAAEALNEDQDNVEHEGFVVVDKNWHRVKIKSPAYLALHHAWNNGSYLLDKNTILQGFKDNFWDEFIKINGTHHPYMAQIHFYSYQLYMLKWEVTRYIQHVRLLYEEYSYERKAVAQVIKNDRLSYFGFKAIGNNLTVEDIMEKMQVPQLAKYIPDFELPDFLSEY